MEQIKIAKTPGKEAIMRSDGVSISLGVAPGVGRGGGIPGRVGPQTGGWSK